ncbi:MAG: RnfABCDGE type electron transport complex subunit D [Planctomycetota bacterium]
MAQLLVSTSPHLKAKEDVPTIMWSVVMMLVPAGLMGTVVFGWYAAFITVLSITAAVVTEYICQKVRGVPVTIGDGSAVLAGMLFAFVMPPNTPWYVAVVGAVSAILIGKQFFGGLGCNIWNPALVGRAVAGAAYASAVFLADWPMIKSAGVSGTGSWLDDRFAALKNSFANMAKDINDIGVDAIAQASPLNVIKGAAAAAAPGTPVSELVKGNFSYMNLLTGHQAGCIGETSAGLLLLGGVLLIFLKIVDWRIPVFYIGTVALLSWILPLGECGWFNGDPLFNVLAGGLMIGAFFMATDMVTSPMTGTGKIIFAAGCGILTVLIRYYGGYPEGVCYSILLMNTTVPLIDRFFKPRLFGKVAK